MTTGAYESTNTQRACTKKIVKVNAGEVYKFSTGESSGTYKYVLRCYDSKEDFVKSSATINSGSTYTIESGISYVGVIIYGGSASVIDLITNGTIKPSMTLVS